MGNLTLENLERFNAQNGGPPGRSSAGNDVASIYTHSVIDGEYEGFELFTKLFLDQKYGLS